MTSNTDSMTNWLSADNTLTTYLDVLKTSEIATDPEADMRLIDALKLASKLAVESSNAGCLMLEAYDELRLDIEALKRSVNVRADG